MTAQIFIRVVGLVTSSAMLILGLIILVGYGVPETVPRDFRIVLGGVMILYAVYRVGMTWKKLKNEREVKL